LTEKQNEIAMLTPQLASVKAMINKLKAEASTQTKERDKQNEKLKKLRRKINELKNERDTLNINVKTLKKQREEAHFRIKSIIETLNTERRQLPELKKKKPLKSHQELKQELENIEWIIQTNVFDIQEEKRQIEILLLPWIALKLFYMENYLYPLKII